ncbi:MAG: cupredoxin domain-containing protein [Dehalococcoidia bacterium]
MIRATVRVLTIAAVPAIVLVVAACSSSSNNAAANANANATNSKVNATTASTQPAPGAAIGSPVAGAPGSPAAGAAASGTTTEVTTDNKYSLTKITIKAGQPATVTVDNKGAAIHNWDLTGAKDDAGKDIKTALTDAGKTSSVTFTISKPGTYKFQCDVHPTEMMGELVVQ